MLWYISLFLSIAVLAIILRIAVDKRKGKTRIVYVMLGCFAVTYLLYLPPFLAQYDNLAAILGGFINALQVITLDADYLQFYDVIKSEVGVAFLTNAYYFLLAFIHIALPLVSALTAVTLIIQYISGLQMKMIRRRRKTLHVFSELNNEAIVLARSIRENDKKCEIVFLDIKDNSANNDNLNQDLQSYVLNEHIESVKARAKKRKVYYYCISADEEENLNSALAILSFLSNHPQEIQRNNYVTLFSTDPAVELMLDSIEKGSVNISIVDKNRTASYRLLQEHPLLKYSENGEINVLLCGFTSVSQAVLRAISWCGQLHGYRLTATVIGQDLEWSAADFKADFPGLFTERYDINFIDYKNEVEFFEKLNKTDVNFTYVVVSENDFRTTIERAIDLRRFFYTTDKKFEKAPPIFAYIENTHKAEAVAALATAESNPARKMHYDITPFGTTESVYSFKNITGSDIENLARNIHLVYEDIFSDGPIDVNGALKRYNMFEVNKNSSRANALHIRYKLLMLGLDYAEQTEAEEVELEDYLDAKILELLTYAEHDRWMAFLESEGWISSSIEQVKAYQASGISRGRHNCPIIKMHPYICPFEELPGRSEQMGLPDSTVYDRELIARIPDILHDKWGTAGKKYKIIKSDIEIGN
ncbi:MAG: hypothetical protein IKL44_05520 [Clostridia bacterium]|nr:hypothetical protein [Clostridia bacterium]